MVKRLKQIQHTEGKDYKLSLSEIITLISCADLKVVEHGAKEELH